MSYTEAGYKQAELSESLGSFWIIKKAKKIFTTKLDADR